jgi:hypothetical protein
MALPLSARRGPAWSSLARAHRHTAGHGGTAPRTILDPRTRNSGPALGPAAAVPPRPPSSKCPRSLPLPPPTRSRSTAGLSRSSCPGGLSPMVDGLGSSLVAVSPMGPIEPVGRAVDGPAFSPDGGRVSQRSRSIVKRLVPVPIVSAWTEPRARSNTPVPPVIALSNEGGGPGLRMPKTIPCTVSWPPGRL